MATNLDLFRKRMEPAKELYTEEIIDFTKKYDALGKLTIIEEPDIDTQEYIYSFEKLNGTSQEELDRISIEIMNHMEKFSKANGIENFDRAVCIFM
jgi:type I site-specific restriction-modification system R (restriction) subunit